MKRKQRGARIRDNTRNALKRESRARRLLVRRAILFVGNGRIITDMPNRAIHKPISIRVESIGPIPTVRELPQETEMTVNLRMSRTIWLAMVTEGNKQIAMGEFVDTVSFVITGTS